METEVKVEKVRKSKRLTAEGIQAKYPGVVEGSLQFVDPNGQVSDDLMRYVGKQIVQRECADCGEIFTVATSDLFQKTRCSKCAKAARKEGAKARRAAERAILAAAKTTTTEEIDS